MYSRVKIGLTVLAICLGTAPIAQPAAVQVNGTCEIGNCASVDVLQPGGSASGLIDFTYLFANTDSYLLTGSYSVSETAGQTTNIRVDWTVTYEGNSGGGTSQKDTFTLDGLQTYNLSGSLDGYYDENAIGYLSNGTGAGSLFSAQLIENGQSIGLLGPFTGVGYHSASNQQYLSGLTNPLITDLQFGFEFGQGSEPGSIISTLAPEPSQGFMLLGGLAAIGFRLARRRRV